MASVLYYVNNTDHIPGTFPAPSSFISLVRHWGLLATIPRPYQGPTRPYQACAKSAPSTRREVPVAWRDAEQKVACQRLSLAAAGV